MDMRVDISNLLQEMRSIKSQSTAFEPGVGISQDVKNAPPVQQPNGPKFNDLFSQAIEKVNDVQQTSSATANAYIKGDPSVDITDVMIASQKSSVAFQALTQVRNKVVEAYKDVMNMPI